MPKRKKDKEKEERKVATVIGEFSQTPYTPFSKFMFSRPERPGSRPRDMDDPRVDYIEGKRVKPRRGGGGY